MTFVVLRFRDALPRLPTSWVTLSILLPLSSIDPKALESYTSGEGRAQMVWSLGSTLELLRLAARNLRCWAVVPSGVSPRLGAVRSGGGCCPVLSSSLHILAVVVAVVAVFKRVSRGIKSKNEPQYLSWLVFVTHLLCLSLLGPSSCASPSRFLRQTRINCPHPSREGRGRYGRWHLRFLGRCGISSLWVVRYAGVG
jgi:hypothetical protein